MIGQYWIKGQKGEGFAGEEEYAQLRNKVQDKLGMGACIGEDAHCWEMKDRAVILSAEESWVPSLTIIPDSEKAKNRLEQMLEIRLYK
jgi:hypothetical protein